MLMESHRMGLFYLMSPAQDPLITEEDHLEEKQWSMRRIRGEKENKG